MNDDDVKIAIERGAEEALKLWMSQHPVSMAEIIHSAVRETAASWFAANGERVVEAAIRHACEESVKE